MMWGGEEGENNVGDKVTNAWIVSSCSKKNNSSLLFPHPSIRNTRENKNTATHQQPGMNPSQAKLKMKMCKVSCIIFPEMADSSGPSALSRPIMSTQLYESIRLPCQYETRISRLSITPDSSSSAHLSLMMVKLTVCISLLSHR
jgi:hypothetical protein